MLIKGVSSDGFSIEKLLNVHCGSDGERFFYFTVKLYNTTSDNFKYIYSIDIFFFLFLRCSSCPTPSIPSLFLSLMD